MKKGTISLLVVAIITTISLSLSSFSNPVENTVEQKLYNHYLSIKNALVASDIEKTKEAAKSMLTTIKRSEKNTYSVKLKADIEKIASSSDIAEQRKIFSSLTEKIYPMIKEKSLGDTSYYQYCPMALNSKGGFWLSEIKEIKNPYFGDMMLKCGSTKETISSK